MTQPATAEDVLKLADSIVQGYYRQHPDGQLPNLFITRSPAGLSVIGAPWADQAERQAALDTLSKLMRDEGVDLYAVAAEAWVSRPTTLEDATNGPLPSQRENRTEAATIVVIERGAAPIGRMYDIERDWNTGAVSGLKLAEETDVTSIGGRLASLLDD